MKEKEKEQKSKGDEVRERIRARMTKGRKKRYQRGGELG